jgi:hypothetical protein
MRSRSSLTFHGPGRGKAWNRQLLAAVKAILSERRHDLNLKKLHGITVGFGLDDLLQAAWNGSDLTLAFQRSSTKRHHADSAGCVAGIMHEGRYMSHVFLDATYIADLVDDPQKESFAANIIAHELAHVALHHWLTKRPAAYIFPIRRADWKFKTLRLVALTLWDEYAACRLSARFGDPIKVADNFIGCLRNRCKELPRLRLYTRKNWRDQSALKTFLIASCEAREPLLSSAYLMGHIDGLGAPIGVDDLCPSAGRSPLASCWLPLQQALRQVWQNPEPGFGFDRVDGLIPVLMEAIRICGGARMLQGV